MSIQELMILVYILTGIIGLIILIVLWVKRHDIMSFFMPEKYALITMLEADNSCSTWLQRKGSDLQFTFNEGTYNMFELQRADNPSFKDNSLPPEINKKTTAIYRDGRLGHFFYNEGNQSPIDFRNITSTSNPQLEKQLEKTEIMQLFIGDKDDFWGVIFKYVLPILIFIGIIIVIFYLMQNNQSEQAVNLGEQQVIRGG